MYRTMAHLITHHGQGFSHPFFAVHTILAAVTGVLSLIGAYFLLTGWRQQNPNASHPIKRRRDCVPTACSHPRWDYAATTCPVFPLIPYLAFRVCLSVS